MTEMEMVDAFLSQEKQVMDIDFKSDQFVMPGDDLTSLLLISKRKLRLGNI